MKTVIEMAIESELIYDEEGLCGWDEDIDLSPYLERFAELVRADEREACAKLADEYATWGGSNFHDWFKKLSADIRARSNT